MKRSDVYILINGKDGKKEVIKVAGYMFQKNGHWFTVRKNDPAITKASTSYKGKWIISDFVTGIIMTSADVKLDNVPDALPESMIDKLIELYSDNSTSIYKRQSTREKFQSYAQLINEGMFRDSQYDLIDLLQFSAYELFD